MTLDLILFSLPDLADFLN